MNSFLQDVFVDGCTKLGECHPIGDSMDHVHDLRMMFDASIPEMGQHALLDDSAVEVTARDVHAAAGIHLTMLRIAQSHHGDIERAATEIKDDNVLRL